MEKDKGKLMEFSECRETFGKSKQKRKTTVDRKVPKDTRRFFGCPFYGLVILLSHQLDLVYLCVIIKSMET